jgi:hypothetical protein
VTLGPDRRDGLGDPAAVGGNLKVAANRLEEGRRVGVEVLEADFAVLVGSEVLHLGKDQRDRQRPEPAELLWRAQLLLAARDQTALAVVDAANGVGDLCVARRIIVEPDVGLEVVHVGHRHRGFVAAAVNVKESRLGKCGALAGEELARSARALDPELLLEQRREPIEQRGVVLAHRCGRSAAGEGDDLPHQAFDIGGQGRQANQHDRRNADRGEAIDVEQDLAVLVQPHSIQVGDLVVLYQDRGELLTAHLTFAPAVDDVEPAEELRQDQGVGMMRHQRREKGRAAAPGADDEALRDLAHGAYQKKWWESLRWRTAISSARCSAE